MKVNIGDTVKIESLGDHALKAFVDMDLIGKEFPVLAISTLYELSPKSRNMGKPDYKVYGLFEFKYAVKEYAWFKRCDFQLVKVKKICL